MSVINGLFLIPYHVTEHLPSPMLVTKLIVAFKKKKNLTEPHFKSCLQRTHEYNNFVR